MKNLLMVTLLFHISQSIVYYVVPDDKNNSSSGTSEAFTLQHYLNNTQKYFKPQTELWFNQGHHSLFKEWILQNVSNFIINGNNSTLSCLKPSIGIAVINVTNITVKSLHIKQCSKTWYYTVNDQTHKSQYIPPLAKSSIFVYHSADLVISNISITINNSNTIGIIGINVFTRNLSTSSFTNTTVLVLCENNINNLVSGIILHYNDSRKSPSTSQTMVTIQQYNYKICGLCNISFALTLIMMQTEYNVTVQVNDTNFNDLFNSSALLYYAKACRNPYKQSFLLFSNCKIENNKGNGYISMFLMEIHNHEYIFNIAKLDCLCSKVANVIAFNNCDFINNTNMGSLINVFLEHNEQLNVYVEVRNCNVSFNNKVQFINTDSDLKFLKGLSHTIILSATKILSNTCTFRERVSFIALTGGMIIIEDSVISNNTNFENIIQLHSSLLQYEGYIKFSNNYARYIVRGREGSYYIHTEFSKVHFTNNFVYVLNRASVTYTKSLQQICTHQFITKSKNNMTYEHKNGSKLNFTVIQRSNTYTVPEYEINFLINKTQINNSCVWLASTVFQTKTSAEILERIFDIKRTFASKTDIGKIPSSVCPCSSKDDYNCSQHEIGSIILGQTLIVMLFIPEISNTKETTTMIAKTYNSSKLGCEIMHARQITQSHLTHECNKYKYTIWYDGDNSECELYLGTEGSPEIFYVNLLPCPVGFSLQKDKKGCYCDQTLNTELITITSCNLEDGTIERPANSWMSGQVINNLNTYTVCTNCPFDYCLPYSSYINLSNPDSQCQFDRSGLLCGHCPDGLSAVFGSSQCMECSNFTLFVIIPIALAGILLVIMLFISNLTVTNGTINIFIFYFNIVSINISLFISRSDNPFTFITLSLFNLDLGIKTCFYNGMDDYAKTWLQLVFPIYLIFIALVLIMGSRYSKTVQKLTARRGLSVLATLFLLSYTKFLLTVCHAIFFYSTVTHLPSEDSALVWSVDTNIPLFGVRFTILFVTCLVTFLILMPFNILLLFTRSLMRFRFVSSFKPLLDVYFGPYKDKLYYWTGLQLLLRAIFFGLSTFDPDVNLTGGVTMLGIFLCVQCFVRPFKSWLKNVQESVILLNLQILYVTTLYNDSRSKEKLSVASCLVSPVLIYFIIFITWLCFMSLCSRKVKERGYYIVSVLKNKIFNIKWSHKPIDMESIDTTADYEKFQESLIALNN